MRERERSCQGFLNGTAISTCKNKAFESQLQCLRRSEKILFVMVTDMLLLPFTCCTLNTQIDMHQWPCTHTNTHTVFGSQFFVKVGVKSKHFLSFSELCVTSKLRKGESCRCVCTQTLLFLTSKCSNLFLKRKQNRRKKSPSKAEEV